MKQHEWVDSFALFDFEKPFCWWINANDEYELYEFSLHTICKLLTKWRIWTIRISLHTICKLLTNHELCITNCEYAHSLAPA